MPTVRRRRRGGAMTIDKFFVCTTALAVLLARDCGMSRKTLTP
jgi:hypothetical protein